MPTRILAATGFDFATNLIFDLIVRQVIVISYVFFLSDLSPNHQRVALEAMKITLASMVALPPVSAWKYKIPTRQMRVNVKTGLTNLKIFMTNSEAVPIPVSCP